MFRSARHMVKYLIRGVIQCSEVLETLYNVSRRVSMLRSARNLVQYPIRSVFQCSEVLENLVMWFTACFNTPACPNPRNICDPRHVSRLRSSDSRRVSMLRSAQNLVTCTKRRSNGAIAGHSSRLAVDSLSDWWTFFGYDGKTKKLTQFFMWLRVTYICLKADEMFHVFIALR